MQINLDKYFMESRKALEKQGKIVNNPVIFDFNYVPKKVFIREEAKTILESIIKFDQLKTPFNLFIYGSRGSGKTVLLRYIMSYLKEKIQTPIAYINCRFNNTSFKVLSELLGRTGRGLGASELYGKLTETYETLVVILDEIDLFSTRDRRHDILYFLSRSERSYMVILLSNNPHFFSRIDPSAKSSLQLEKMHFRNYNAVEVYEILKSRCREGLNQYNREDLRKISALTVRDGHGDIRVAIKTLQYTVTNRHDKVEANFEKAKEDIFLDLIYYQSDQVILILKATQVSKQKLVKPVYEMYKILCRRYKESPYSYMHFYNNLSYLQSIGLVLLIVTRVHRAKTNSIELLFDEGLIDQLFSKRFLN